MCNLASLRVGGASSKGGRPKGGRPKVNTPLEMVSRLASIAPEPFSPGLTSLPYLQPMTFYAQYAAAF